MQTSYKEYGQLNLPAFERDMLATWDKEQSFLESIKHRDGAKPFVFYVRDRQVPMECLEFTTLFPEP